MHSLLLDGYMEKNMNSIKTLWSVLSKLKFVLGKNQKKKCIGVLVLTLIGAILETIGISIILPFVQAIISIDKLIKNTLIQKIMDTFNMETGGQLIVFLSVCVISVYLLKNAYLIFLIYVRNIFQMTTQKELSMRMMNAYVNRPYEFYLNQNIGKLTQGINGDVVNCYLILNHILRIAAEGLTILLICSYILYTDFIMAFSIFISASLSFCLVHVVFKKKLKKYGILQRKYESMLNQTLQHTFNGIKEIKVMHQSAFFENQFEKVYNKKNKALILQNVAIESPSYVIEAICASGVVIMVCIRMLTGMEAENFIPQLATFVVAAFRILPSVAKISGSCNAIMFGLPCLDNVYVNIQEVEEFERQYKEKNEDAIGQKKFKDFLEIKNVTWTYPNSEKEVLSNISIRINRGDAVALIGESGAGKTTLADIILGLFHPQKGKINMDGVDIFSMREQWSKIIGYVPQSVFLMDDTLKKNIAFGIEEDSIDEDLVWSVIKQAQLEDVVLSLPDGLQTIVGEHGIRFSGGQRQRIAIARALYHEPSILVLDEATSALDNDTENAVMEAVDSLQGKKTLIIVAHRLSTIKNCNKIYEIKNGKALLKNVKDL